MGFKVSIQGAEQIELGIEDVGIYQNLEGNYVVNYKKDKITYIVNTFGIYKEE